MNNLNFEKHFIRDEESLAGRLAQDIQINARLGRIIVVATLPDKLLRQVYKDWQKLVHFTDHLRFANTIPQDIPEADVTFVRVDDLLPTPPICRTICITYPIEKQKLYLITSWMPPGSLVILYENA